MVSEREVRAGAEFTFVGGWAGGGRGRWGCELVGDVGGEDGGEEGCGVGFGWGYEGV